MRVTLPIIGQAYAHRSADLSAQTLKNWYAEYNKEANKVLSLQPWPGLSLFAEGKGDDGGMTEFQGHMYKVSGFDLVKIPRKGQPAVVGKLRGSGRCSFASTDIALVIVRNGFVHSFDGQTLTDADDADFESPNFVASLNSQAIYDGEGQRFCVSDADSLTHINGLNFAAKESRGDNLVRPYIFNDVLYLFGEKTAMQWWNSGSGNPPFDPIQNGTIELGLLAGHSVASTSQFIYFLADDYNVYRLFGSNLERVSTIPLSERFRSYAGASDAIGFTLPWNGQDFYYLKFGSGDTWIFCEQTGGWSELTIGADEKPYPVTSSTEAYGRRFMAIGGSVYTLDNDVFEYAGETVIRERSTSTIHSGMFFPGQEGKRLAINELELVVKNVGLTSGQGSRPTIMLSWSSDGRNWTERALRGNPLGRYTWRLNTRALGSKYEWLIRIRVSDPIVCSIQSAVMDVEVSI